jgi:glycosyltransferase involved in cell wall biosynthesis
VLSEMEGAEVIGDLEAIYRSDFRPVFREWAEEGGRQYRERRAWLQAHMSRNLLRADLVVAPSRHMRDAFARAGVPAERLVHRPYGIRAAALAEVGSRRRRSGDGTAVAPGEATAAREAGGAARGAGPLRVAFLGTLTKHKGVHVLLRAFEGLPAGRARLRIHGWTVDRRYREWLRTLSARPDVEWRGEVERDDLPAVFAETDVLVVPSTWVENCPIVIQEAYLAGVPVVASNVGALPEFVRDGESGLLFEVENPDSLRRTLLRILDDPGLLERLRAGIPAVRPMDDEARYFEEAYARLVGERVRMHAERPAS